MQFPSSPNYGALSGSTNFCGFLNVWSGSKHWGCNKDALLKVHLNLDLFLIVIVTLEFVYVVREVLEWMHSPEGGAPEGVSLGGCS